MAVPWLLGSLVIIAAALSSYKSLAKPITERRDLTVEMVQTCAVLHLAFVAQSFGNQYTWRYYSNVLVPGLAAASRLPPTWRLLVVGLARRDSGRRSQPFDPEPFCSLLEARNCRT